MKVQALPNQSGKIDILFYNSINKAKKHYLIKIIYHFIKALIFIIFLPIDVSVLESNQNLILVFMGVALGASIFNMAINIAIRIIGYSDTVENNSFFINMAQVNEHLVTNQHLNQQNLNNLSKCVSDNMYNMITQTTIDSEGLNQQIKNRYESMIEAIIRDSVLAYNPCLKTFRFLEKTLSLGVIIFGIVALATSQPSTAQIVVIVIFLVLEAINVIIVVILVLIIALLPILCCGLCFWRCCCYSGQFDDGKLNLPAPVKATPKIIMQGQGSCSICLQAIKKDQDIIILPCSNKHMFHDGCLNNWVKVRPNCPICRYKLNQN